MSKLIYALSPLADVSGFLRYVTLCHFPSSSISFSKSRAHQNVFFLSSTEPIALTCMFVYTNYPDTSDTD